jgi:hypothetical protein
MRFIKRLVARYKIYLRKLNRRNTYDTEKHGFNAKQCSYICRKLIHDQNSELLFAPISYKIYIKNEEHGIFITMEGGEVTITNHTYSYFIKLNNEKWIKLEKYFFKEMESGSYATSKFGEEPQENITGEQPMSQQDAYFSYGKPTGIDDILRAQTTDEYQRFNTNTMTAKEGGLATPLFAGGGTTRYGYNSGGALPTVAHSGKE